MTSESKSTMISARVLKSTVSRIDFVVRNTDSGTVKNRSAAMLVALEAWLLGQERRLQELGVLDKKAR